MSYLDPLPIPHQSHNAFVSFLPSQGIFSTQNILPSLLFTLMLRGHFLKYRIFFQGLDHLSSQWKKLLNDFMRTSPSSTTATAFTGWPDSATSTASSHRSNGRISSDLRSTATFIPGTGTSLKGPKGLWDVFMKQLRLFSERLIYRPAAESLTGFP